MRLVVLHGLYILPNPFFCLVSNLGARRQIDQPNKEALRSYGRTTHCVPSCSVNSFGLACCGIRSSGMRCLIIVVTNWNIQQHTDYDSLVAGPAIKKPSDRFCAMPYRIYKHAEQR